ncbi:MULTISPECIES: aminotransferase yhxA [unclassified Bacillus (in: firmicutes)]|uniref:aminotransferase yhxA n=1 Tax=unclassified Bacillus (in: firmicutes) TaxID=185979 RepID=UPI001BE77083|nr:MULTISPECIES: aminotransferase yhxA [unclassified Bacillus (in: firmicutes)]MBT2638259.1 aminotransferase yhxA [Bacillus sp. ISL-39]MBT2661385.1 aminotransferase yhxA [Bacillus sp. ISL-45]
MGKTKKVIASISATALMVGLAGCNNNPQAIPDRGWEPDVSGDEGQDWNSEQDEDIPPVPEGTDCSDWEWDNEDGVWECDDNNSPYFGHYFFAGMFFANRSLLYKSNDYMKYKNSTSFKGARLDSNYKNTSPKGSSGFGSGSRSTTGG